MRAEEDASKKTGMKPDYRGREMGWGPRATALGGPAQEERRAEGSRE